MNEQNKFLEDLGNDQNQDVDILDAPLVPDTTQQGKDGDQGGGDTGTDDGDDKKEDGDDQGNEDGDALKPRNRRERRLLRKLNDERESSIFLAGKLEAREEAKRSVTEEGDYLKQVERIYGTDSPEAQLATELLKKALTGVRDDAENRAYERIKAERQQELEEERKAQSEIDNIVDEIEDSYDVTLNETQERSFLQLLQKMSPKDKQGRVSSLADPHAVWEVFQERLQKRGTDNRAKTLSARSMTQSGASKDSTLKDDSTARFLQDSGII